uniref:Ribosomal RNA-processing protein 7 (RRP7), putative n=1 Tax=Theileria annulata TaxID=5874 RepID=A0A3B0MQ06_THEAN
MTFVGHLLNISTDDDLPFYSQILLTSSYFHKQKDSQNLSSKNNFLFKSLDPLITKSDIKNIILHSKELSEYFNIKNTNFEVTEKGNNLYNIEALNPDTTLPKVLEINYKPSAHSNLDTFLKKNEHRKPVRIEQIQKMCDEYMAKYDLQNELNKKLRQKKVTDEEGFELVTSGPLPVKASDITTAKKKRSR